MRSFIALCLTCHLVPGVLSVEPQCTTFKIIAKDFVCDNKLNVDLQLDRNGLKRALIVPGEIGEITGARTEVCISLTPVTNDEAQTCFYVPRSSVSHQVSVQLTLTNDKGHTVSKSVSIEIQTSDSDFEKSSTKVVDNIPWPMLVSFSLPESSEVRNALVTSLEYYDRLGRTIDEHVERKLYYKFGASDWKVSEGLKAPSQDPFTAVVSYSFNDQKGSISRAVEILWSASDAMDLTTGRVPKLVPNISHPRGCTMTEMTVKTQGEGKVYLFGALKIKVGATLCIVDSSKSKTPPREIMCQTFTPTNIRNGHQGRDMYLVYHVTRYTDL